RRCGWEGWGGIRGGLYRKTGSEVCAREVEAMKLILCAVEDSLVSAWQTFCGDLDFVTVFRGSILDVECDAVVSPANSFGFMDGGIDALYLGYFGPELQGEVRQQIAQFHNGELIVGAADIVQTGQEKIPYLVIAPTMRVPMVLGETVNPYLAARAVFLLVECGRFLSGPHAGDLVHDYVDDVPMPGLGTGV